MPIYVYVILVIVLFLIYVGINYYFKQRTKKSVLKLARLLLKKDYQKFDKLIQDPKIQKAVSPYQRYLMSFNSYLERQDLQKANKIFAKMNNLNLVSRQKLDFYGMAQNYYIQQKDYKRADICHEKLQSVRRYDEEREYFNTIYEVMRKDNTSYQQKLEARINHEPKEQQLSDFYLLGHIYQLKGDKKKVEEVKKLTNQLINKIKKEQ